MFLRLFAVYCVATVVFYFLMTLDWGAPIPTGRYDLAPRGHFVWAEDNAFTYAPDEGRSIKGQGLLELADLLSRDKFTLRDPDQRTRFEAAVLETTLDHLPEGKAGLDALIELGHVRRATKDELFAWQEKAILSMTLEHGGRDYGEPPVTEVIRRLGGKVWTIQSRTRFPSGLTGADTTIFFLPDGVPEPEGDIGDSVILYVDGTHDGPSAFHPAAPITLEPFPGEADWKKDFPIPVE